MRRAIFASLLWCAAAPLSAETAKTNYRSVYGVFHASAVVDKYPRLIAISKIESKDPSVSPASIKIEIKARSGTIQVPIDAGGRASFPMTAELVEENPAIVSDQPAGSLRVSLAVEVHPPTVARLAFAEMLKAMEDVESATAALSQEQTSPKIDGLELRFAAGANARVTVSWDGGEDMLIADPQGRVFLRRDLSQARGATTQLQFSSPPLRVLPRIERH